MGRLGCARLTQVVCEGLYLLQHLAALGSYELQLSSLSSALSKMEHLLRQEQDEKVHHSTALTEGGRSNTMSPTPFPSACPP